MKKLILVRHAKAVDGFSGINDFERSLKPVGIADAHNVSQQLKKSGIIPDCVISSPAFRAYETAVVFSSELEYNADRIILRSFLYNDYDKSCFCELLSELNDNLNTVFVFAHNPNISSMISAFCSNFMSEVSTCTAVAIELDISSWSDAGKCKSQKFTLFEKGR